MVKEVQKLEVRCGSCYRFFPLLSAFVDVYLFSVFDFLISEIGRALPKILKNTPALKFFVVLYFKVFCHGINLEAFSSIYSPSPVIHSIVLN